MGQLLELYRNQEQERIMQRFFERIKRIMDPFEPGDIWMHIEYNGPVEVLVMEITNLRSFPFRVRLEDMTDLENAVSYGKIAVAFSNYYNKIYVQPDDHIQLGLE